VKQLRCGDLNSGDIMLKAQDGTAFAKMITFAERLAGQLNPLLVHAGIMFDTTYIIEARKDGITANDLRIQDKKGGYIVYRATTDSLAKGAGTCAKMMFDIHQRHGTAGYNFLGLPGAVLPIGPGKPMTANSMDQLLDGILTGKGHRFFCSQFLVYVYQFVGEQNGVAASQMFNVSDARVSPSTLASLLQSNHRFKEAGYMLPDAR